MCAESAAVREEIHISASATPMTSSTSVTTGVFWERLWRMSGINFIVFLIIAYVIYDNWTQVPSYSVVNFFIGLVTPSVLPVESIESSL